MENFKFKVGDIVKPIKESSFSRFNLPLNRIYIVRDIGSFNTLLVANETYHEKIYHSSERFIYIKIPKLLKIL